jgi:hypothetical protein
MPFMVLCLAGPHLQGKTAEAEPLYRRFLQLDAQAVQPDDINMLLNMGKTLFHRVSVQCLASTGIAYMQLLLCPQANTACLPLFLHKRGMPRHRLCCAQYCQCSSMFMGQVGPCCLPA